MVQLSRATKFTGICVCVYVTYVLFVFILLPSLMPDVVTLQRALVAYKTRHLGNLSNYTLETGGQPLRSMLVSFRGSGALTLLDNLAHQPGCYQHYAPLIAYHNRSTAHKHQAQVLDELVALYNCNYNKSSEMIHWGMRSAIFRRFYGAQSKTCLTHSLADCWNPETMAGVCKLHPFINMAVYNMRLEYLVSLLEKEGLNLRILLLVRDPRGTMYLRKQRQWCVGEEDCEAETLCKDMVSDHKIAETLVKNYPRRFEIIRYEDLLEHPEESIKLAFDFYGIPMERPKTKTRGLHSRSEPVVESLGWELPWKYSIQPAYEWMHKMPLADIQAVQNVCTEAMELWDYRIIQDFEHFSADTFEPFMGKA
ncbi:carbohydrate sulfotransferase 5 [Drosophila kikkawai]|uniref:Carbohydrate sulfotransferase 5 n=1 Tax=Drosophila kikkawai TaxID=30033 RepID=A0A6P4JGQ3_DROKI|nr:carbohydrate sulfotransferase 5 [Drosophila kikkawai]